MVRCGKNKKLNYGNINEYKRIKMRKGKSYLATQTNQLSVLLVQVQELTCGLATMMRMIKACFATLSG